MNMSIEDVISSLKNVTIIDGPFEGGQKKVYKCIVNNKINALKFILSASSKDEGELRCERELATLHLCDSKHLIKLGEIPYSEEKIKNGHIIYYSEEWIEGYDLSQVIKKGDILSEEQVKKMAVDISYAIEELWKHNKVHRDIKPMNIMYDVKSDRYVLLDLGMVFDATEDSLTRYGCLVGTLGYYSPEQFDLSRKNDLDFRSDLFCLGIVMYQLLTGRHPFLKPGDSNDIVFEKIKNGVPEKMSNYRESISKQIEEIVFRLLRKRPSERFRSCEIFRKFVER